MEIVKTIKRIALLNNALDRIPFDDRYDDIWDSIMDKRAALNASLRAYINDESFGNTRRQRRQQIRLACKLLNLDKHQIMRLGYC